MSDMQCEIGPLIEQYITVILRTGANLRPGQTVVISSELTVEGLTFIHRLAEKAYMLGGGNVIMYWQDQAVLRLKGLYASQSALQSEPIWRGKELEQLSREGAAFLTIIAPDPRALADVDPSRMATIRRASASATTAYSHRMMNNEHVWVAAGIPTTSWARQVFPQISKDEAVLALWRFILRVARADQPDPLAAWQEHLGNLSTRRDLLNKLHIRRLHYRAPGTDLSLELPEGHKWIGGAPQSPAGHTFVPNIPLEEVFTLPKKGGVNGTVRSTLPLFAHGQLIEHLSLTFERGRIVSFSAEKGEETLRHIIETDEGSHYLGEVALVPVTSPCNIGIPLYNTLFDENASCHLAIGQSYPACLERGDEMRADELAASGANSSMVHVDFMIGSEALDIDGETANGGIVPIMRQGIWAPNMVGLE